MRKSSLVLWTARTLAFAVCCFLAVFALDEFEAGKTLYRVAADVTVHLLPSALVLAIIVVSWRRQWIGGVAFVGLAAIYAVIVGFRPDWVLVISGPLLTVGLLFLWSWRQDHRIPTN